MTDIEERLRRLGGDSIGNYGMPIATEAADEIRRLRRDVRQADQRGDDALRRLHNADACIDAIARALRGQGVNDQYEAWDRIVKFVAEYRTNPAGEK